MSNLLGELQKDIRFLDGLKGCINCGCCTAVCPAAQFFDYDPRQIADTLQKGDELEIEKLLQSDTIWFCGECFSCKSRCPMGNTPGYIIQALRKLAQQNGFFVHSQRGRQQLQVKRIIGDSMLKYGYCIYVDEINTDDHLEQGLVWDWFRNHTESVFTQTGCKLQGPGSRYLAPN